MNRKSLRILSLILILILFLLMVILWIRMDSAPVKASEREGYPKLGMWWMDVENESPDTIAQYDLLLDSFDRKDLQEKLEEVRKINPQIKVFKPLSPSERSIFWEGEDERLPNPEIVDLPSDFFLLQMGTEITEDISLDTGKIRVETLYYENGAPLFREGSEVAIGESESAHILSIDWQQHILTLERGYGRPASSHPKGTFIASHLSFWPGTWVMNVTSACPKKTVPGLKEPVNWVEYFHHLCKGDIEGVYADSEDNEAFVNPSSHYDGILIDRFEDSQSWLRWMQDENLPVSLRLSNKDTAVSDEEFDRAWKEGVSELVQLLQEAYPSLPILRNNPLSDNTSDYEGQVYESSGWSHPTTDWWEKLFLEERPDQEEVNSENIAYMKWFDKSSGKKYVLMEVYQDEGFPEGNPKEYSNPFTKEGFRPDYQRMRFSLTSTLLGDGYYSYEMNTAGHGAFGLMWFDEYDNGGQGKGYLGEPVEDYQKDGSGIYLRHFEKGLVLVNPTDSAVSIQLDKTYRKIKGKVTPDINDGSELKEIRLAAFDGIILLKP